MLGIVDSGSRAPTKIVLCAFDFDFVGRPSADNLFCFQYYSFGYIVQHNKNFLLTMMIAFNNPHLTLDGR